MGLEVAQEVVVEEPELGVAPPGRRGRPGSSVEGPAASDTRLGRALRCRRAPLVSGRPRVARLSGASRRPRRSGRVGRAGSAPGRGVGGDRGGAWAGTGERSAAGAGAGGDGAPRAPRRAQRRRFREAARQGLTSLLQVRTRSEGGRAERRESPP